MRPFKFGLIKVFYKDKVKIVPQTRLLLSKRLFVIARKVISISTYKM